MDRREAETCKTFGSSICSEETTATTTTQLLYNSSSNKIKTDKQEVERYHADTTEEIIDSGQQVQVDSTGLSSSTKTTATTTTTNSWNLTQETTTGLEANKSTASSHPQHTSLAKQLGRRLTAPLTKANIKRCHRKLANLQLHHYHQRSSHPVRDNSCHKKNDQHPLTMKLLSSTSTVDLCKQTDLENPSFCEGSVEGLFDKHERKSLVKNMQISTEFNADKSKKSPEKCATNLRQARRRKRHLFMRRSTKSAPG